MKQIFAIFPLIALAACGGKIITDGDLKAKLESSGYSKVIIQPKRLDCGRFGQGKHFIGRTDQKKAVVGQICYKKLKDDVSFKISVIRTMDPNAPVVVDKDGKIVPVGMPWSKSN